MNVTGIVTQSRASAFLQWVSSYKFLYSLDCAQFTYYNDTNSHMVRHSTLQAMFSEGFPFYHFNITYYSWCLVPVWRL